MKLEYYLHNIAYFLGLEKTYHLSMLYKLFDEYNKKYFEGKLPHLPILVDNNLGDVWGRCTTNINIGNAQYIPLYISINMKEIGNNKTVLRNVMVHEMVHYWEYYFAVTPSENFVNAYRIWLTEIRDVDFSKRPDDLKKLWDKISLTLGHGVNDIHSDQFKNKCHELNEKFPELWLSLSICSPRL